MAQPITEPVVQLPPRRLERLLDVNPQEALPRGVHTPHRPGVTGVRGAGPEGTAFLRDRELYRMRNRPELYDPWMRDVVEDARAQLAEDTGQYDWDCRVCKAAVMTYMLTDKCPRCGA